MYLVDFRDISGSQTVSKTAAKFGDRNLLGSLLAFGVPVAVALNVGELLENRELGS